MNHMFPHKYYYPHSYLAYTLSLNTFALIRTCQNSVQIDCLIISFLVDGRFHPGNVTVDKGLWYSKCTAYNTHYKRRRLKFIQIYSKIPLCTPVHRNNRARSEEESNT